MAGAGVAPTYSFNDPGHSTNVAGAVFYMLLGISLFEGNMVASGFESYLVALCFEVVRLAKYNLYRYIGCIIYQSNWSGPFSLVVMTPDL